MKKVLLAHPGTQHAPKLAEELMYEKLLYKYITCFLLGKTEFVQLQKFGWLINRLKSRLITSLNSNLIENQVLTELLFKALAIMVIKNKEDSLFLRNMLFQKRIKDQHILNCDVVIGFDTSSWLLVNRTLRLGKKFILDQSIGHPLTKESIYKEVNVMYPEWSSTIHYKSSEKIDREIEEQKRSTKIVVASEFTKRTLADNNIDTNKIIINPYGVDLQVFKPDKKNKTNNENIIFLFVGTVTSRKGIPFLLDVWSNFQSFNCTLWIVGPLSDEVKVLIEKYSFNNVKVFGKVPHSTLPNYFQKSDVFVFPSFFEGFGLVLLEALASGLPIISTDATASPDLITNGQEGFTIKSGNKQELHNSIEFFLENPARIKQMGFAARKRAELFSWQAYGDRWANIINTI